MVLSKSVITYLYHFGLKQSTVTFTMHTFYCMSLCHLSRSSLSAKPVFHFHMESFLVLTECDRGGRGCHTFTLLILLKGLIPLWAKHTVGVLLFTNMLSQYFYAASRYAVSERQVFCLLHVCLSIFVDKFFSRPWGRGGVMS